MITEIKFMNATILRQSLKQSKRIVVKVGTRVLVNKNGQPNTRRIKHIVDQLATLHQHGHEVTLVTSGAIGAGLQKLKFKSRPKHLPDLQMAAAVGQTQLLELYNQYFSAHKCIISQVLLTHDDLKNRTRHLNARNTLNNLLHHRIIPIINENDVVSVDEIKIGDNDVLSGLVSLLINADLLVLLTSPNGLRQPHASGKTTRVPYLPRVDTAAKNMVTEEINHLSTGGMQTKLAAAQMLVSASGLACVASGLQKNVLIDLIDGKDIGTLIGTKTGRLTHHRKRWIAYFHKPQGKLTIDTGAAEAICHKNKSLLAKGITQISGQFNSGSLIDIIDSTNRIIARGLSNYTSQDIEKIKGQDSKNIAKILGSADYHEVIHRDNLVILE